jgi:hypothetical protein
MRRAATAALASLVAIAGVGCGLRDPADQPATTSTAAHTATISPPATAPGSARAPVEPGEGPPGSAQRTLYEYALTYGNFTAQGMTGRAHALETLATAQLARTIERESLARGHPAAIPSGASMSSEIVNLDLAPSHANHRQAVVVLEQRLTPPDGSSEEPITNLFVAEVVLTRAGWRVAHFTPQQ